MRTINHKHAILFLILLALILLAGCAAKPNPMAHKPASDGNLAGFWLGLWHGMICPITFIISLFSDSVHFYEVHNNGGWYNFGFVLGASILSGGGKSQAK